MTIQPLTASLPVELILHLTGTYVPTSTADRGEVESGGDLGSLEDMAIEGLTREVMWYTGLGTMSAKRSVRSLNLLANVDTSNPHVQTLLSNLLSAVEAAAGEALMGEVE